MRLHFTMDQRDRLLGAAVGLSLALHAVLLSLHFRMPDNRWQRSNAPLEVVLVNAKTRERPSKAEVLAQANLNRGGTVEERRRARTPLPVTEPREPGKDLADAQRRQRSLEARQEELLAQARQAQTRVPAPAPRQPGAEETKAQPNGRDLADLSLAAMRLQAQIDRQIQEYQERPRRKFIGANASEYRFAQYEEDWRAKVERIGTNNYPDEARGKLYGSLQLSVTLRPDGHVESVYLDRSSGLKVLDAAALKIVRMATPFAAFPADIRRDTDLLTITRTWFFGKGDKIWTE
ncbi:MAG TPA: TonB family protein [Burkholderiales bacterium]|nr:TonB family protein [Burkholderiales bacterium]